MDRRTSNACRDVVNQENWRRKNPIVVPGDSEQLGENVYHIPDQTIDSWKAPIKVGQLCFFYVLSAGLASWF